MTYKAKLHILYLLKREFLSNVMPSKALPALRRFLHCLPGLLVLQLLLCALEGCSSDVPENQPGISADTNPVGRTSTTLLHDTGVELFASGLARINQIDKSE